MNWAGHVCWNEQKKRFCPARENWTISWRGTGFLDTEFSVKSSNGTEKRASDTLVDR